ncbi:hypothetical protein FPSE_04488 [Fusarium pseudograminearum CS3096]|uniref:Uncharacterized protein n=1 Tax=Fusarium pseudograminearum (strain CS3096) TaxID=1028729 RepID=K3VL91_FUSPC|nr:hypothetical protein FPSE_04488 [Fusarium pseudograminearum CS3096]EKJ75299.1 hypothetical protein FPSE_04488 [Fusarium pseudograminearum CS3096]
MAGPTQEEKGAEIVRKINARLNPREIDFSVDACSTIPVNQITSLSALAFSENIVAEIFREAGIPDDEATQSCWNAMAEIIMPRSLLQIKELQYHIEWGNVVHKLNIMRSIREVTGMPACMGAQYLTVVIAAVVYRKIQPERLWSTKRKKDFVEFFGNLSGMQWLPIAIQVYERVQDRAFAIELDDRATEPKVRHELIHGKIFIIVTTKKPQTNIYEAAMQAVTGRMIRDIDVSNNPDPNTNNQPPQSTEAVEPYSTGQPRESIETDEPDSSSSDQSEAMEICDGSSSPGQSQHPTDREECKDTVPGRPLDENVSAKSGSASKEPIGKSEPDEVPMGSIASVIVEDSPETEPQQHQSLEPHTPDSKTLRGHARQMKALGKRLPSPDQRFVKRVRRDIRQFAKLSDQKEEEMVLERESMRSRNPPSSEHAPQARSIDLFGRYKMLWKGILRENGSIPESLRELVRHDCDSNQLFYLEETEADFLAANAMRNENGQ